MKKILSLFIALFVMSFCAKAQVSFIDEGFESSTLPYGWTTIDADGDGYNWDCATPYNLFYTHSGVGCIASASYINNIGALTPDNWLITPQVTISAGDSVSFWYRGQSPGYAAENFGIYVSTTGTATTDFTSIYQGTADSVYQRVALSLAAYAGQNVYVAIRHYNVTDMFWLNIDDFSIGSLPTTPSFGNLPATVDFGLAVVNMNKDMTVNVTAYALTSDITATTTAPFSVSADGTTFGTAATLTAATAGVTNATLYVRYSPTAVGADNATLTLASTGATSATIALTGVGTSCTISTFPYNFGFDDASLATCWDVWDANNDNSTFSIDPSNGYAYYTYNSTNAANDYLISPEFVLTGSEMGSFDYWSASSYYPESFMVYAFGATDTVLLVNTVTATNTSSAPMTQYIPLNNLTGTYRIAIKCTSDADEYRLYVDNFSVVSSTVASITVNPTSIDFGTIPAGLSHSSVFDLTVLNASSDITLTTAAPFTISTDGTNYAASVTIPTPSSSVLNQTVYVAFTPTAADTYAGEVVVSTTGAADTVSLAGAAISCDVVNQFPFVETFSDTSDTRACWFIDDANNDNSTFVYGTVDGEWVAAYIYNASNAANDYLISPAIQVSNGLYGHLDYFANGYTEKFSVYVIPENGSIANAVNIVPAVTVTNTAPETQYFDLTAYANQTIRIAIKAESDPNQYYLFIDNFTIEELPVETIIVDPASMSFAAEVGMVSAYQSATVEAYSLTNDITLTATAPFEVSVDGTTFGTTATIAQSSIVNTTVYVRFAPTAVGNHTGSLTLTTGSTTATMALTGEAVDCAIAKTLPYAEGFETGDPVCWLNIDNDGDSYAWRLEPATETKPAHSGNYSYTSESYINGLGALHPDNWLITPALVIPGEGAHITWWVAAQDPGYPSDYYEVKVSNTTPDMSAFTTVYTETISSGNWEERNVNLNYPGQTIYVAFVHTNCSDNFRMKIDDISVAAGVGINDIDNNISIYPNPASSVLNVNANSNIQSVEVMNLMGQTIQIEMVNGLNTQINTSSLSNGVYMLRVTTENGVINQKFTVAR